MTGKLHSGVRARGEDGTDLLSLSRRSFLTNVLGSLVLFEMVGCAAASAKPKLLKKGKAPPAVSGPHSLSKQAWPPAIVPDYVDIDRKGYLCFSDQSGRFSIVDLRKAGSAKNPPTVMAQLSGLGKRVLALKVSRTSPVAYALAVDFQEGADSKYYLVAIDLKHPDQPSVISRTHLDQMEEAGVLLADKDVIYVGGKARSGEYIVAIYAPPGKKGQDNATFQSSLATKLPVVALDYQKRQLIIAEDNGSNTRLEFYNMSQLIAPVQTNSLDIKGTYTKMMRLGDVLFLAGATDESERQMQAASIALRPAPHAVSNVPLDSMERILSATVQKGNYLVLAKSTSGKLCLNSLTIDKFNNLQKGQTLEIPVSKSAAVEKASLVVNGKEMYVTSGWSGVQVLNGAGAQWSIAYNYKIPRLAAAGIAAWGNQVVLVGAELMLYDITDPSNPQLTSSAPLSTSVRAMVGAGSYILCLEKEEVTLRKMAQLDRVLASVKVPGRAITFDKSQHKAYVIQPMGKLSRVFPIKVFSDNLEVLKTNFDLPGNFTNIEAVGGNLLVSDIHEVALYNIDSTVQEVGRRKIENLAIRDVCITDHNVLATAIDPSSKGSLLVMSRNDKTLNVEGTIDLPHNGTALSAINTRAVTVGQDHTGKDLISIIDISNAAAPNVKATFTALEAASAVAVQSKIALVAGRGLEIVTL